MVSLFKIGHLRESRPDPVGWEYRESVGSAGKDDLLWYFFPGDVEIVTDDLRFTSRFGSVPALHFVAAVVGAREVFSVREEVSYTYFFTEVDHCIKFQRKGCSVYIECSFNAGVMAIPLDDFLREVCVFCRHEIRDLGQEFPDLLSHPFVRELLNICSSSPGVSGG